MLVFIVLYEPFWSNKSKMSFKDLLSVCESGQMYMKNTVLPHNSKPANQGGIVWAAQVSVEGWGATGMGE